MGLAGHCSGAVLFGQLKQSGMKPAGPNKVNLRPGGGAKHDLRNCVNIVAGSIQTLREARQRIYLSFVHHTEVYHRKLPRLNLRTCLRL